MSRLLFWFFDSAPSAPAPVPVTTTTEGAIRDTIIALIEALSPICGPKSSPDNVFKRYLNEGDGDFQKWARANPQAAFRRFQVRDTGDGSPPDVTNTDVKALLVTFVILVAYPQNHRLGKLNALSRDDVMRCDQHLIERTVGLEGIIRAPETYPLASWVEGRSTWIHDRGVDFLRIQQTMRFYLKTF